MLILSPKGDCTRRVRVRACCSDVQVLWCASRVMPGRDNVTGLTGAGLRGYRRNVFSCSPTKSGRFPRSPLYALTQAAGLHTTDPPEWASEGQTLLAQPRQAAPVRGSRPAPPTNLIRTGRGSSRAPADDRPSRGRWIGSYPDRVNYSPGGALPHAPIAGHIPPNSPR